MSRRRCCCDEPTGCPCSTFSFDFEVIKQTGAGGTDRSIQLASTICSMLPDVDDEGSGVVRLEGFVQFVCTTLEGWQYDTGTAASDPNVDFGSVSGYRWERPPAYSNRCDDESCAVCDTTRVLSWVVSNDTSAVTGGQVQVFGTLPGFLAGCFPSLPASPSFGLYRVVWVSMLAEYDRASREVITGVPYNGGLCLPNFDTTGSANSIGPIPVHIGFVWDTSAICLEGELVGAFEWDGLKLGCDTAYPFDNDFCTSSSTDFFCDPGPSDPCCPGTVGVPVNNYRRDSEACLFDSRDADATNWATT